jgi:hypothetical protein
MKSNQRARGTLLIVLTAFAIMVVVSSSAVMGKAQSSNHDLSPQIKSFENYSKDFKAMEQPLKGQDLEVLFDLDHTATTAGDRLYAANAALEMYDGISFQPDRLRAKRILKEKLLDYYSWAFDQDVTRTAGVLTFVKIPAAAQLGLRMKDDMRTTKEKLDAIAASLQ